MKNAFGTLIWAVVIGGSALLGACGDDDGISNGTNGGDAAGGDAAGGEPSGSGGSSRPDAGAGGQAGSPSTGDGGQVGEPNGGAGGALEGGGGAPDPAGGAAQGGEGGAGNPPLEYACTANTINHQLCSAYSAAACEEEFDCATCVADRKGERELFEECGTCQTEFDKFFQCGIDAFEAGNLAAGVECVPGYGPDMTLDCYDLFESAMQCGEWASENACPETWPLD